MKLHLILFAIVLCASSFMTPVKTNSGKNTHTVIGYSITTDGGTTGALPSNLEQLSATYQTGKGKSTTPVIIISGIRSNTRLQLGLDFKLWTHYDSGPMPVEGIVLHPNSDIMLYKFSVDKKNRTSASPLQIMFTQVDKATFRIDIPAGVVLDKGEYAFIDKTTLASTGAITVWCFGID